LAVGAADWSISQKVGSRKIWFFYRAVSPIIR
jgi:hypothetical protein